MTLKQNKSSTENVLNHIPVLEYRISEGKYLIEKTDLLNIFIREYLSNDTISFTGQITFEEREI